MFTSDRPSISAISTGARTKRTKIIARRLVLSAEIVLATSLVTGIYLALHLTRSNSTLFSEHNNNDGFIEDSSGPCLTFVGDTMLANLGRDFSADFLSHPRDSFQYVRPLLRKCSVVIANLEGPISKLGLDHDPKKLPPAYSFNMDPDVLPNLLIDEGITHVNRANNHLLDRGEIGVADTTSALDIAGLRHFGSGTSKEEAAKPLIVDMTGKDGNGNPLKVGITGYSELYNRGVLPNPKTNQTGTLTVTSEHARLGCRLLDEQDVGLRVAFVHWGLNYRPVSMQMREQAAILVEDGKYDLIIGSDGSHSVQRMEYISGIPVLYDIGNFLFHTRGRFNRYPTALPYGLVVHVNLDRDAGRFASLELHCLHVDNMKVEFQSSICSGEQAASLFSTLGPHVNYRHNQTYATVYLKGNSM